MTRISLVDLEAQEQARPRADHCIILMEETGRVRGRSQESELRESPSKRPYNEESLVFETRLVDGEGEEQTVGAIGMVREEAANLSWRHFRNYMIRNSGIEKNFSRKSEVRVYYIDDEDDEIFVDTDDEYRELLNIALAKNKIGETMVLKFVSFSKARRSLESRRRSCGDRKVDLLGREVKTSPGKVMKHQTKHFDTISGKVWKINGGKCTMRGKIPGKMTPVFGPPPASKPVTIADGLNEVKELSRSLEEAKISPSRRLAKSPETYELLRQQASVFDWMNKNAEEAEKDSPPTWFVDYMENYRDEMAAEITTKVVHSLGIIIDNKLAGLVDRRSESKVDESDFAKKVRKDKVKVKKVKSEAMRMTMELEQESVESKELKKLKKSLIKKTDKVVKVAMKIEKKNHQEQKARKTSIPSSSNTEQVQAIKLSDKKEKKAPKIKEEKKTKKIKPKHTIDKQEDLPLTPEDTSDEADKITTVVTSQPRAHKGESLVVPRGDDQLPGALLLPSGSPVLKVQPSETLKTSVPIINMGCLAWGEAASVQRSYSSEGLLSPSSTIALPKLEPGQQGQVEFQFTAPASPGLYESVWHFWMSGGSAATRFGPALTFKVKVEAENELEMKDYSASQGREMVSLGSSVEGQEMVDMGEREQGDGGPASEEGFDLLAEEVTGLSLESTEAEDEFEVIPIPDCFNLEVPFEIVDSLKPTEKPADETEKTQENEGDTEENKSSQIDVKKENIGSEKECPKSVVGSSLEEAMVAVELVKEKLGSGSRSTTPASMRCQAAAEEASVAHLVQLGFANRSENQRLLRKHGQDLEQVVRSLSQSTGGWAEKRH